MIGSQLSIIICTALDLANETRAVRRYERLQKRTRDQDAVAAQVVNLQTSFHAMLFALKHMYRPLLVFAAKQDYTAENILFATRVREFKTHWLNIIVKSRVDSHYRLKSRDLKRMFEQAARIYFELVDPKTARFPVNLGSKQMQDLAHTFRSLRYIPDKFEQIDIDKSLQSNPWEQSGSEGPCSSSQKSPIVSTINTDGNSDSDTDLIPIGFNDAASNRNNASNENLVGPVHSMIPLKTFTPKSLPAATPRTRVEEKHVRFAEAGHMLRGGFRYINEAGLRSPDTHVEDYIPHAFKFDVFDEAARTIKRDIFNNTWKRFVADLRVDQLNKLPVYPMSTSEVARRGGLRYSQMTDIEAAEWDLESDGGLHQGVLDMEKGPIPIEHVDARCRMCRNKIVKIVKRVFSEGEVEPEVEVVQDEESKADTHGH